MSLLTTITTAAAACSKNFKKPFNLVNRNWPRNKSDNQDRAKVKSKCGKDVIECYRGSYAKMECAEVDKSIFHPKPPPHKSMWDTVPEYKSTKPHGFSIRNEYLPLLDWLYYRRSDKAKRQYQKTWADCPNPPMRKLKKCGLVALKLPPIERRKRKEKQGNLVPGTACECNVSKFAAICKPKPNLKGKCPFFQAPKCSLGRKPPRCPPTRPPTICKKYCCPYSAYSECCQRKPATIPRRSPECFCSMPPGMCIVYREMEKQRSKT